MNIGRDVSGRGQSELLKNCRKEKKKGVRGKGIVIICGIKEVKIYIMW